MALKPEVSLTVAAATGAVVYGIFQMELPSMADVHSAQAHNPYVATSVNVAGWEAAAVVAGISLLAKDPTVFVVGGSLAAFMTWRAKHANMTNPATGQVTMPPQNPGPSGPQANGQTGQS
jgi:hypothetical protein